MSQIPYLSETDLVAVVTAAGIFERRLLVLEKPSLDIRRAARATRLRTGWLDVPADKLDEFWS